MEKSLTYLDTAFRKVGLELTEEQIQQFFVYYEMLVEKNKVMNLTAITEFEEVAEKHFQDSLTMVYLEKELEPVFLGYHLRLHFQILILH